MISTYKLLPVLIFVAMLAFSVRLVEVSQGITTLSGAAYAAESDALLSDEEANPLQIAQAETETGIDSLTGEGEPAREPVLFSEEPAGEGQWRDPSYENPAYDAIKMEVFDDLAERRQALEKKERELSSREAILKAAELELDRKYQELDQLRREIERLLEQQSEEEKARVRSLVKIYEGMKAKDAARIFDTLDLGILVSVVSQMSERKISPILAEMNPERARTVTIMLAEQKKLPSLPQSN